jgi:NAD(P)-dependent dehydrogenase (short-subunit alcohol dehydrogenase family)
MPAQKDLRGKVALITGAGSGLGEATAYAFAQDGCAVACVDINQAAVERVRQKAQAYGVSALALRCDVKQAEAVFSVTQSVQEHFGHMDILVNCAAIDYTYSVEEMSVTQWDQELAVNLRGPFLFAKAVFPFMKAQGGGHIVNIASTASLRAWANASAYHASKWGLLGLSRGLSVEGRPHRIRVTTMIPGGMQTHFFDRFLEQGIPMPDPENLQDPAIVAEAILFAVHAPITSAVQEILLTPVNETSWP